MSRPKISLIGGGQVGGNIALLSAQKEEYFKYIVGKSNNLKANQQ